MTRFFRQTVTTVFAVMIASAFPLAQAPSSPARTTHAPVAATQAGTPAAEAQPVAPAPPAVQFGPGANADQTRDRLREIFDRHAPSLRDVLRLDPTLLTDANYLAPYPEVAAFLTQHPEVAHNPAY